MKIVDINAIWLQYPIPKDNQHVSDFGRLATFDMALVEVKTDVGITGYGEGKSQVGSSADNHAMVSIVEHDLKPMLVGRDPRHISALWEQMYNGVRAHYALTRGRGFPRPRKLLTNPVILAGLVFSCKKLNLLTVHFLPQSGRLYYSEEVFICWPSLRYLAGTG